MATTIRNGVLYDGTGNSPRKADVVISGGKIELVGSGKSFRGGETIDATGMYVIPGFIETALRADDYCALFSPSHEESFLMRGVSSVVMGGFGESLVPFSCSLVNRGLHDRCDIHANRDWETARDLFLYISKKNPAGVNFGTFIGFQTLRHCVSRGAERDLSVQEFSGLKKMLSENLDGGAAGLSINLSRRPGMLVSKKDLSSLAELVKEKGKILSATLRGGTTFEEAFAELYALAAKTGVSLVISDFPRPYAPDFSVLEAALTKIEHHSAKAHINFDFSPWSSEEGMLRDFLPDWARRLERAEILADFSSPLHRKRLVEHFRNSVPKELSFGAMPDHLSFLEGKTLAEFASGRGSRVAESFLHLLKISNLRGEYRIPRPSSKEALRRFISSPLSVLASGSSLFSYPRPAGEVFSLATETETPLERIVMKYSLAPAKKFGILGRGILKEGYSADIAVCDDKGQVKYMFVNGVLEIADGKGTGMRRGMPIVKEK